MASPLSWSLLFTLAFVGCSDRSSTPSAEEPTDPSPIVAVVDGDVLRVSELRGVGNLGSERERRRAVSAAVTRRLAAAEARRGGLADSPEMRDAILEIRAEARAREETALRDALFRGLREGLDPSPAALEEHYAQTQNRYLERQVELLGRTFPSREAAEAFEVELGPSGRLDPGSADLIGPAAIRDLPRGNLPEALALREPGDRVLVGTEGSWTLVELVAVHPARVQPFEDVRDRVEQSWRTLRAQEAFQSLLAELEAASEIEIDEATILDESIWTEASGVERRAP